MRQFNMNFPEPLLQAVEKAAIRHFKTPSDLIREIITKEMLQGGFLTEEDIIAYMKAHPDGRKKANRKKDDVTA